MDEIERGKLCEPINNFKRDQTMNSASSPLEKKVMWPPKAMSGQVINKKELSFLFKHLGWKKAEEQGWQFIASFPHTPLWKKIYNSLVPFNQEIANSAGALILLVGSHGVTPESAWQELTLHSTHESFIIHTMAGVDYERLPHLIGLEKNHFIDGVIAVGKVIEKEHISFALSSMSCSSALCSLHTSLGEN